MATERTEAQMRAASMLLVIECALSDLYPGNVWSMGTLWDRKIYVQLNDLDQMVIDFTAEDGIRTYMVRTSDQSDGGKDVTPLADFKVNLGASVEGLYAFTKDLVCITAESIVMDPVQLVHKIAEIANNAGRLQQAAAGLEEAVPMATPVQQPQQPT